MAIPHAWRLLNPALALIALTACQGANFGGGAGGDQFAATGKSDSDPEKSEDQRAAGSKDGADAGDDSSSGKKDTGGDELGTAGDEPEESDTTVATGPLGDSPCRFFGKTQAKEVLPGGPPIPVKVADKNGTVEGNDYHFELAAYQGCYGAEAQNNRGDPTPHTLSTYVSQITGVFFGSETGNAIGEASALGYQSQCGNVKTWSEGQPKPYGVKNRFRGVVLNAKSVNCVASVQQTEKAFWVRENGDEYSGCFALGSKLRLANGQDRIASLVVEGTELYNPLTKRGVKVTRVVIGPEQDVGMFVVGFDGGAVTVTSTHPFPTKLGLKPARELTPADRILGEDGKAHALTRLEQRPVDRAQVVVNFIVNPESTDPRDHMILADGVVTGDLHLQQELAKERLKTKLTQAAVPPKL